MKVLLLFAFVLVARVSVGQLGVGYQQSNLPFFNIGYEGKSRLMPELRIGLDNYISETSVEGVVLYKLAVKEKGAVYIGLGGRVNHLPGLVIPVGMFGYPFGNSNFGPQFELAPIIGASAILRGSGGIRYRFGKNDFKKN